MVLGVAAIQGFVLIAILYFNNRGSQILNRVLCLLLFLFSLILLEESLESLGYSILYPRITGITFLGDLYLGPLTYIYAVMLVGNGKKIGNLKRHFYFPVALTLLFFSYHLLAGWSAHFFNNPSLEIHFLTFVFLKIFYLSIYQVLAIILLSKYIRANKSKPDPRKLMAVLVRNVLVAVLVLIPLVLILETTDGLFGYDPDMVTSIIMMIAIYSIGYAALVNPVVYPRTTDVSVLNGNSKYRTSALSGEEKSQIVEKLEEAMRQEKYYLDPELNIEELSKELSINKHHLSQVLNEELGQNFYDFVNKYRVEEFKRRVELNKEDKINVLTLGHQSGFNSKATLNRAFKKLTGDTPSAYINLSYQNQTQSTE